MGKTYIFAIDVSFIANKTFIHDVVSVLKLVIPIYINYFNILLVIYSDRVKTYKISSFNDLSVLDSIELSTSITKRLFTNIKNSRCITFTNFISNKELHKIKSNLIVYSDDYFDKPDNDNIMKYSNQHSIIEAIGELFISKIKGDEKYFIVGDQILNYESFSECILNYDISKNEIEKVYFTDNLDFLCSFIDLLNYESYSKKDIFKIKKIKNLVIIDKKMYDIKNISFIKYVYWCIFNSSCFEKELFKSKLLNFTLNKKLNKINFDEIITIKNFKDIIMLIFNNYYQKLLDKGLTNLDKINIALDLRKLITKNIKYKTKTEILDILILTNSQLFKVLKFIENLTNFNLDKIFDVDSSNYLIQYLSLIFPKIDTIHIYEEIDKYIDHITSITSTCIIDNLETIKT